MEELTEVITAAEFHPNECNLLVYSSSKGSIRLCDMRAAALCDRHSKRKCYNGSIRRIGNFITRFFLYDSRERRLSFDRMVMGENLRDNDN